MTITAEVVPLEDNRVRLDVAVAKGEVDKTIDRTIRQMGRELRVPGFRPGKVPASVVLQRFGRDAIVDQTLQTMQDLITTPSSPTGALIVIETRTPTDAGQGKRVISVWHFANKTWCYATDLTAIDTGWRVAQWGQIARCS